MSKSSKKKEVSIRNEEFNKVEKEFNSFFRREFKREPTRVELFIYKNAFKTGWNKRNKQINNLK